ncbi:tetratricopeptide repeat protein [Edaphobacter modestus]|uniref:Tfp pilus assembly protein PilF n=1 Tax=Edaphobacter modestus TaxID=388466 RepID=A0A4Q7XZ95_9BACT|nr:tetratricopeptide repeat protein [Edaphobacter modestus]RZU29710.1 Tfp pilus assembly protein PilF [Edaphobacter modestus]
MYLIPSDSPFWVQSSKILRPTILLISLLVGVHFIKPPLNYAQQHSNSQAHATALSLARARSLLQAGKVEEALASLREIRLGTSSDSDVHLLTGICLAMMAQPIESSTELNEAIALRPKYAPTYMSAGLAFASLNNLEMALDHLSTALRLDPDLPNLRFNYALVLSRAGNYAESEKQLDIELGSKTRRTPVSLDFWRLKARDAYSQKKWQDALYSYTRVRELEPDSAEAYSAIGECLYSLNQPERSMAALQRSIVLEPDNETTHVLLGKIYQSQGRDEEAIAEFEIAMRLVPDDREVIFRLSRLYTKTGNMAAASNLQKQLKTSFAESNVQSINEQKATVLNNTGIELERKGYRLEALEHYDQAAKTDTTNLVFARNAALLLCKIGRTQEAIERLKEILAIDPDDAKTIQILTVANEIAAGNLSEKETLPESQR